jgi:hypothetical protein
MLERRIAASNIKIEIKPFRQKKHVKIGQAFKSHQLKWQHKSSKIT